MARMSSTLVVALTFLCAVSLAQDEPPVVLEIPAPLRAEVNHRSLNHISIEGNQSYSAESIREALGNQNQIHEHLWPKQTNNETWTGTSREEFAAELSKQIVAGYRHGGYLNAKVTIQTKDSNAVMVTIDEGSAFTANATIIDGTTAEVEAAIRQRLSNGDNGSLSLNGIFQAVLPGDAAKQIWQTGEAAAISPQSEQQILERVNQTLEYFGYNYAKSAIEFDVDQTNKTADLHITITPGQQNPVRELVISGLTSYSDAEVRQIIKLKPDAPASPQLCRQIEAALVASGRFLFAESDADVSFVEGQPVDINVRVREFSEVASGKPLTQVQQSVVRYAKWLSDWSARNEDFVIEASLDMQKCQQDLPQGWQKQIESASNMLKANFGNVKIRLVASPTNGVLLKVKAESTTGEQMIDHTFVNTQDLFAVVSHLNHRKWMVEGKSASGVGTRVLRISMQGRDPATSDRRLGVTCNLNTKSGSTLPMATEMDIQPSALLCSLTSRFRSSGEPVTTPPAIVAVNKDGRKVVRSHGHLFAVETDLQSGQLLSAIADYDAWRCEIKVQTGQLKKELAELQKESHQDTNFYQVDHGVMSGIDFLAAEIESNNKTRNIPILKFAVNLLSDPVMQSALTDCLDTQSASRLFPLKGSDSTATLPIWLTPQDQVLRQVIKMVTITKPSTNTAMMASVTMAAMSREEFGPVSCALLVDRFRQLRTNQLAAKIAMYGQRRLTTESLVSELEAYLNPATPTGAFAYGCVRELKKLNEEEATALVASINPGILQLGGRTFTAEQPTLKVALAAIRNHQNSDPAVVLQDCLTVMCELWKADLNDFFTAQQQPVTVPRSFFRAASSANGKPKSKAKSKSKRVQRFLPLPTPAADLDLNYQR